MNSNKKNGNDFEHDLCEMLSGKGFWAHNMANRKNGQPADVIAVKDGLAALIDAKECLNDTFPLSRIEDNQHSAMRKWELCGNNQGWFALKTSSGVYMLQYGVLQVWETVKGKKSLNMLDIMTQGYPLEMWMNIGGNV